MKKFKRTCAGMLHSKPVSCPEQQKTHSGQKGMVNHDQQQRELVRKRDGAFPVSSNKQQTLNPEPKRSPEAQLGG